MRIIVEINIVTITDNRKRSDVYATVNISKLFLNFTFFNLYFDGLVTFFVKKISPLLKT